MEANEARFPLITAATLKERAAVAGAARMVYAILEEDKSDIQTDYFATQATRRVFLGFTFGTRKSFKQTRKMAAGLAETQFLVNAPGSAEHRDTYSMGRGLWLGTKHRYDTGWYVKEFTCVLSGEVEDATQAAVAETLELFR